MERLRSSAPGPLKEELHWSIAPHQVLLNVLCEDRPVELVRAKCASHEEGAAPPEEGTNTSHLHEVLSCGNDGQTEVEVEEDIRDQDKVQVAAMGWQQNHRPLANCFLDLHTWRKRKYRGDTWVQPGIPRAQEFPVEPKR